MGDARGNLPRSRSGAGVDLQHAGTVLAITLLIMTFAASVTGVPLHIDWRMSR